MNKKLFTGMIAAAFIMLPLGTYAAPSETPANKPTHVMEKLDPSKLNDKQKADLKEQMLKMMELRKETVQKMVKNGALSAEEGKAAIQKIDERIKSVKEGNLEFGKGKGMRGKGHCRDKGANKGSTTQPAQ